MQPQRKGESGVVQSRYILRNGERISYFFEEKKVKNINLRVTRDGSVHVSAPPHTPSKKISDLVAANAERIRAAQKKIKEESEAAPIREGDTVFFLGEPYRLVLAYGALSIIFEEGKAILSRPSEDMDVTDAFLRASAMAFYPVVVERCMAFEAEHPFYRGCAEEICVRPQKSVWATCNYRKRRLTFSAYLAEMPPSAIDGVIAHEYVHFFVHDHGKNFYKTLDALYPRHREELDELSRLKHEHLMKRHKRKG